jgi:L1 cell adhesion molecule like protein
LKNKVEAKNSLESYCYSVKNTVNDDKYKDKLTDDEKKSVLDKVDELTSWLTNNQNESKETYDEKYKELEVLYNPLASKIYANPDGTSPNNNPDGMPDMSKMKDMMNNPQMAEMMKNM